MTYRIFPAAEYPYAFEVFGNNGTTPEGGTATSSSNHSLNDLTNTVPNAATVYTDLMEAGTGSGSTFIGSDHYPIVGDYMIVPPAAPVLTAQGFQTNRYFQIKLASTANNNFGIQTSTNLTSWTSIGSGVTDTNGSLIFQDTNAAGSTARFYRANWPSP